MSNDVVSRKEQESSSDQMAPAKGTIDCQMRGKGWLKGGLMMALCCAAPLLLVGAIAFFGLSLGALASSAFSLAALLACPIGMFLMMRMMMKDKK